MQMYVTNKEKEQKCGSIQISTCNGCDLLVNKYQLLAKLPLHKTQ